MSEYIEILKGIHNNCSCAIIGNGPSILKINESYFSPNEAIFTINDSIVLIEKLNLTNIIYSVQKDKGDGVVRPNKATLLVSEHESKFAFEDYKPRYIFDAIKLFDGKNGCMEKEFSANCILKIVQLLGCTKKIKLIGFDACTNEDIRRVGLNQVISEDKIIPYLWQCGRMQALIKNDNLNVEFVK